uniref:Putative ovule protein n=1 Tax=Solanum chacoense TaxID=4108 RepID=A0A0V0HYC8_SOLCH
MERQNASSPFSFSNFNPITPSSPMKFGFSSTDSGSSSPVSGDTVPGLSATVPSWLLGTSFVSTDNSTLPWFSKASSSTVISSSLGPTTTNNCFSDSLSSVTSPSSVSEITTTVSATSTSSLSGKTSVSTSSPPQSTVSAPGFVIFSPFFLCSMFKLCASYSYDRVNESLLHDWFIMTDIIC